MIQDTYEDHYYSQLINYGLLIGDAAWVELWKLGNSEQNQDHLNLIPRLQGL